MFVQNLSVERIEQEVKEWENKKSAILANSVSRTLQAILAEAKRHHVIKDNPFIGARIEKVTMKVTTTSPNASLYRGRRAAFLTRRYLIEPGKTASSLYNKE
jgi:hypothetical protein